MSPEQATGGKVGPASDVYSLGATLYECLTLQKMFTGDSLYELLHKHVSEAPPSARAVRPEIPEHLESVMMTALAKLPDHRFASTNAMSMALQHATSQLRPEQWATLAPSWGNAPV
jgi:serine/threonine-protein kinase